MDEEKLKNLPLAQVEDQKELIARYRIFSDEVLVRWMEAVIGPHREAMEAILRERGKK